VLVPANGCDFWGPAGQTPSPSVTPVNSLRATAFPYKLRPCIQNIFTAISTTPVFCAPAPSPACRPAPSGFKEVKRASVRRRHRRAHLRRTCIAEEPSIPTVRSSSSICLYSPATPGNSGRPRAHAACTTRKTVPSFPEEMLGRQLKNATAPTALLGFLDSSF
jgi:hypothetical protein